MANALIFSIRVSLSPVLRLVNPTAVRYNAIDHVGDKADNM